MQKGCKTLLVTGEEMAWIAKEKILLTSKKLPFEEILLREEKEWGKVSTLRTAKLTQLSNGIRVHFEETRTLKGKGRRSENRSCEILCEVVDGKIKIVPLTATFQVQVIFEEHLGPKIIPLVAYLQHYGQNALKLVATKKNGRDVTYRLEVLKNIHTTNFMGEKFEIARPEFKAVELLSQEGVVVYLKDQLTVNWMADIVDSIMKFKKQGDTGSVFYEKDRDFQEEIAISAIIIDMQPGFLKLQMKKLSKYVYVVEYYEDDGKSKVVCTECKGQTLVNIKNEIADYMSYTCISEKEDSIARATASLFMNVMILMRPYDWQNAKKEEGGYYSYRLTKFPQMF